MSACVIVFDYLLEQGLQMNHLEDPRRDSTSGLIDRSTGCYLQVLRQRELANTYLYGRYLGG